MSRSLVALAIIFGIVMVGSAVGFQVMVLVLTTGALFLAIYSSTSLVSLLLLGFAGVAQLFPGVVLGLFSRRVTTSGVFAGLVTGVAIALFLMLTGRDPYRGVNAGFIALCFNLAVTGVVSMLTRVSTSGFAEPDPVLTVTPSNRAASA